MYTLRVDGVERRYRVQVPAAAVGRTSVPVVIVLHGGGGSGRQVADQTGFSELADRAGFLAVYPDGSGRLGTALLTWNAGTCCGYARDHDVDDVGFIRALTDVLVSRFGADRRRIYVTGFSNGAMLAYRLGCELADRIAAIAPVSGALDVPSCQPTRPLPVYVVHGDADPIVPYRGGASSNPIASPERAGTHPSVADTIRFWATHDGCPAAPTRTVKATVTSALYQPCSGGTEVRLDTVAGGGHAWPGGKAARAKADQPNADLDATNAIWTFFARYRAPF